MVSLLIRLLALLGLLWTGKHVVNQVSSAFFPHRHDNNESEGEIGDETVKDPVCQTYIPKSLAVQRKINEEIYYFCSEECASKFSVSGENQTEEA